MSYSITIYFMLSVRDLFISAGESTNIKDPSDSENVRISTSNAGGGLENKGGKVHYTTVTSFLFRVLQSRPLRKNTGLQKKADQDLALWQTAKVFWRERKSLLVLYTVNLYSNSVFISTAVLAGGIVGVILAATLAATLIYKWQKKDNGGFILGRRKPSDEDYHRHKIKQFYFIGILK
uniref:Syndecan/Neurexin domain-containing protein n=1 Tax=Mola mola TaxID=94237 RepID=A0A3Q3VRF6_MOLML